MVIFHTCASVSGLSPTEPKREKTIAGQVTPMCIVLIKTVISREILYGVEMKQNIHTIIESRNKFYKGKKTRSVAYNRPILQ